MEKMQKFFLKHCKIYRKLVDKLWGLKNIHYFHIPFGIYGNFDVHYMLYNQEGNVKQGCRTLQEALQIRKTTNYGITVLYDRY